MSHSLWDIFAISPGGGKLAHVVDVAARQPCHLRELGTEVGGETVDDLGAPTLVLLAREDLPADTPVELDQLLVDGKRGTQPSEAVTRLSCERRAPTEAHT
jgi:hypothetical protein